MGSILSSQANSLESLFIDDTEKAIIESQKIICSSSHFDSYEQFYTYHLNHSHISTCQNEWQENRMSIHCFDCSNGDSSCICLQCFLNGDHKGHNYSICPETIGNCDCGDTNLWKRSGFCKNHQGLNESDTNPENYLDEELRTVLTNVVFKSAFSALTHFKKNQDQSASKIFQFITSFLKFGDGFRRLIAISLTEKINFFEFLHNVTNYSIEFNQLFQRLCGNLINDQIFKQNFSKVTFSIISKDIENPREDEISVFWYDFFYHSFSPQPIQYHITQKWNWIEFTIQFLKESKEIFKFVGNENFVNYYPRYCSPIINSISYATTFQPNEPTQKFFDRLFSEVLNSGTKKSNIDTVITVSYKEKTENNYYLASQLFKLLIYPLFNCFKFKKNLKYEVLIEQLKKNIIISPIYDINKNENDKLIFKFINNSNSNEHQNYPGFYYESFHNGASFYFSLPLYDSFVTVLGLENISKIKISRLLMNEKCQQLRIKLCIITLKKLLSFGCYGQSLTPKNFGLMRMVDCDSENASSATFGVARYLPVFQLLIGLQCNQENEEFSLKEFLAYEMAREIGLFDDFESDDYKDENLDETKSKMIFLFLYLSLLLVVERILFNFDSNEFIREQLICALKSGKSDINELNKSYDKRVLDDYENPINFNKVLFDIASVKNRNKTGSESSSNKEDISLILKEDVKWNTISGVVSIHAQKSMLNNEISNHPDSLISIQEFEPEETYFFNAPSFSTSSLTTKTYNSNVTDFENEYSDHSDLSIRLKDFLLTPTVLAVVYHTLRMNNPSKIDLNDHLSLNILILISKFVNEKPQNDQVFKETINYESINELIQIFRQSLFNYKIDEKGTATVENVINFTSLLNMKISYQNSEAKTLIDLIISKGEIGKTALQRMSIDHNLYKDNTVDNSADEKLIKKQRAKMLKEDIMNRYKTMISNYNMNENDNDNNNANSSIELTDSADCLISPTSSCVINGTADVCSICSAIKKNENLSYPLFIYQTKFPFIIDKPPLVEGSVDEISVTCDDDVDFDTEEEEESNESSDNFADFQRENDDDNRQLFETERQLQSVNNLFQIVLQRASNNRNDESVASSIASFQELRREILIRIELIQNRIFIRRLKFERKKLKRDHKRQKIEEKEKNLNVPKRYTAGANFVVQFALCQHLVHPSCVESKVFHCPIDRTIKNGFLPCLEFTTSLDSLTENEKQSIDVFLSCFRNMIVPIQSRKVDIFIELIKSLSGLIVTFEIRLRNLPDCLDSNNTKLLARNLFLTTWYAYRIQGKPPITDVKPYNNFVQNDVDSRLTTFQRFIKELIQCDDLDGSFNEIVKSFVSLNQNEERSKRIEKEIFIFLRRVCLSKYFLLGKEVNVNDEAYHNKLVDWDEVLSIESLSTQFGVTFSILNEEIELKPFICSNLPREFLHFALEPYNLPVDLTNEFTYYNLIDYNYLIDNYNDIDDDKIEVKNEDAKTLNKSEIKVFLSLNFNLKHYPSAILLIGKYASRILLIVDEFTTSLKPFYLDKYGSPDFGFERGEPLFLNDERYERFIDEVLSGNFSYNI